MATDIDFTFHSSGGGSLPGGGNPDYTSPITWEGHTDLAYANCKVFHTVTFGDDSPADFPVATAITGLTSGATGTIETVWAGIGDDAVIITVNSGVFQNEVCKRTDDASKTFSGTIDDVGHITLIGYYKAGGHAFLNMSFSGASGTSTSRRRIVRSATTGDSPAEGANVWDGTETKGCYFVVDDYVKCFVGGEAYFRLLRIGVTTTAVDEAGDGSLIGLTSSGNGKQILFCRIWGVANVGVAKIGGIAVRYPKSLIYGCIVNGTVNNGHCFEAQSYDAGYIGLICNTAVNADGTGKGYESAGTTGNPIAWGNYGADNGGDFEESATWRHGLSHYNCSKDATADLGDDSAISHKNSLDLITGGELDGDLLATTHANMSGNGAIGERWGRNPVNDISATEDFDFFGIDPLALEDIAGNARLSGVDAEWDVGASQFVAAVGGNPWWYYQRNKMRRAA